MTKQIVIIPQVFDKWVALIFLCWHQKSMLKQSLPITSAPNYEVMEHMIGQFSEYLYHLTNRNACTNHKHTAKYGKNYGIYDSTIVCLQGHKPPKMQCMNMLIVPNHPHATSTPLLSQALYTVDIRSQVPARRVLRGWCTWVAGPVCGISSSVFTS